MNINPSGRLFLAGPCFARGGPAGLMRAPRIAKLAAPRAGRPVDAPPPHPEFAPAPSPMLRPATLLALLLALVTGGCATRPVNPPIADARPTPLAAARRIIVFVVNSLSSPPTRWDESESAPGPIDIMMKAAGTPIDQYSYEAVELLKDTAAGWRVARELRASAAMKANTDPAVAKLVRAPEAEIYAIDVSFAALQDKAEFDYLNALPTSFTLPPEAVDRLRAAAGEIIRASPEFKRLLRDAGAALVPAAPPRSPPGRLP